MPTVKLIGPLRSLAGIAEIDIEAKSVNALLTALAARVPALAAEIEAGVAVAIDGQIYQDALLQPISAESEVHILPQIAGG